MSNDARTTQAVRDAAQWLVRLHSGRAQPADWQALAQWRAQDTANEQAWQNAERLGRMFSAVPSQVGLPVLARSRRIDRRAALRVLALATTVPAAAWLGWRHAPWQEWMAQHRTASGERLALELPDGTHVLLNTASALDVAFDERQRLLRLRCGEVLVTTGHDAARPFLVETPQGRLRALGTRFSVRLAEDHARVAVFEGAVEVSPRHGAARVLKAGEQTRFDAAAAATAEPVPGHALAWIQGVLYAEAMRLDDFAAELGRYRGGVLRCDPAVAQLRISGAFQLRDTDQALAMLGETLPVRIVQRTRWWVLIAPA